MQKKTRLTISAYVLDIPLKCLLYYMESLCSPIQIRDYVHLYCFCKASSIMFPDHLISQKTLRQPPVEKFSPFLWLRSNFYSLQAHTWTQNTSLFPSAHIHPYIYNNTHIVYVQRNNSHTHAIIMFPHKCTIYRTSTSPKIEDWLHIPRPRPSNISLMKPLSA